MRALAIAPYVPAALSLLGSSLSIYVAVNNAFKKKEAPRRSRRGRQPQHVFFRLLLTVSSFDWITSFLFLGFGSWAVPQGTGVAFGERGTETTCRVAGTTAVFLTISVVSNTLLTIYHVLVVVLEKSEEWIQSHYVDRIFLAIPIAASFALLIITNVLGFLQPMYILSGMCGPEPYPPGCIHNPEQECTAGVKVNTAYIQGPLLLSSFLVLSISMILMVRKVWLTERKLLRYATIWRQDTSQEVENSERIENGPTDTASNDSSTKIKLRLTKTIGLRGLFYTGAYFLCYICYGLTYVLPMRVPATPDYRHVWFPIAFGAKLLTPLKGFFNVFIFLAPRYQELTQEGESLAFVRRATQHINVPSKLSSWSFGVRGSDVDKAPSSSFGAPLPPWALEAGSEGIEDNPITVSSSPVTSTDSIRGVEAERQSGLECECQD